MRAKRISAGRGCVVSKHHESYAAMEKFVNEHLRELCAELVEWQDTGLLRQCRLRELAALCTFAPDGQLRLAERMTEHAAIRAIADDGARVTVEHAREALEDMDDYARMNASVDAKGPREVLERFVAEHERDEALLRQALEALEFVRSIESLGMVTDGTAKKAIAALRERLSKGA